MATSGKLYESLTTKFIKNNPYTSTEEIQRTRREHRQLVKTTIEKVKAAVDSGQLKVSIADLDKLMRLDLLLMGEPDSNSQVTPGVDAIEEQRMVMGCLEELNPEESRFLCDILAKIVNQRNILAEQQKSPLPIKPEPVALPPVPSKKAVPQRTPVLINSKSR